MEAPETDPELQAAELGAEGESLPATTKVERKAGTTWLLFHGPLSAPLLGNVVDASCLPDKPVYDLPSSVCQVAKQHSLPGVVMECAIQTSSVSDGAFFVEVPGLRRGCELPQEAWIFQDISRVPRSYADGICRVLVPSKDELPAA